MRVVYNDSLTAHHRQRVRCGRVPFGHIKVIDLEASLLKTEIGIVHRELAMFRDELLPAILAESLPAVMSEHSPDFVQERSAATSNRLSEWRLLESHADPQSLSIHVR